MTHSDRLIGVASRLGKVGVGSTATDAAIYEVLGLAGPVQPYSTSERVARTLLPPGFEWMFVMHSARSVYAPCRCAGADAEGLAYPHHGQWASTTSLALCGAALRAWAMLAR